MEGKRSKINIRLHVYDMDIPVSIAPENEPFCRSAAKLITEKINSYSDTFRTSRSEKEILYMAMLDIAIAHELEKSHNDTEPYDNILTQITAEIEEALGVGKDPKA